MDEDDDQDDDVGEDRAHNIVVSDMDSMDSSDFNDSVLDEDNFGDDEAATDGQKAGVDVAEENFVDDEAVDGQKAGVDVDAITECTSHDKYSESNEQHVTGPNLRPRGTRKDPKHILGGYGNNDFLFALIEADASFWFLTQWMSLKKGLKHFQNKGDEILLAEMSQLHYRKTIKPVPADSMTREQKRQALRYLIFLKEKRCGRIKARRWQKTASVEDQDGNHMPKHTNPTTTL
jgi:hypothetical protein